MLSINSFEFFTKESLGSWTFSKNGQSIKFVWFWAQLSFSHLPLQNETDKRL